MKKLAVFLIAIMATVMLSGQPLTHRGGNSYPAQVVLVEFPEYLPGDLIYSAYQHDGQLYASWVNNAKTGKFMIQCWGDDSDSPVKTGINPINEQPVYLLYRNFEFTILSLTISKTSSYFSEGNITDTRQQVVLNSNLYHSLCPQWPSGNEISIFSFPRMNTSEPLNRVIKGIDFLPKFTISIEFELIEGDGRLTRPQKTSNLLSSWKYRFQQSDFDRGYIKLLVKVTPFVNCFDAQTEKEITVLLK